MFAIKSIGSGTPPVMAMLHEGRHTKDEAQRILDRMIANQPSRRSYLSVVEVDENDNEV